MITFEEVQTIARKAFDPETISVVVGKVNDAGLRFKVVIRDEFSKLEHVFHVNVEHSVDDLKVMIEEAGAKLGLIRGPDKVGDEIVTNDNDPAEGAHNHD